MDFCFDYASRIVCCEATQSLAWTSYAVARTGIYPRGLADLLRVSGLELSSHCVQTGLSILWYLGSYSATDIISVVLALFRLRCRVLDV